MSTLTSGPETWPWGPGDWGDPCMTGCLECQLASPVFAQSWSQTATDGAWYSTTALPSGRDRPRCLCVLRLSGSEPQNSADRERSDLPPKQQPPRDARRKCGARPLSTANVAGSRNTLIWPTSNRTLNGAADVASRRGLSVDHQPSKW